MKRIVLLKAPQSHGKSNTLLALARILREERDCEVMVDEMLPDEYDKFIVVRIGVLRVAAITAGDRVNLEEVSQSLARCLELNVDVVYCASWTAGIIYNLIWSFADTNNYRIVECAPCYCFDADEALWTSLNSASARMLFSLLDV